MTEQQNLSVDPTILFMKPKAISQRDKRALREIGVLVIEVDDPQSVKFVRAAAELSSTELLIAAVTTIKKSEYSTKEFGAAMIAKILSNGAQ